MKICEEFLPLLDPYVDGELTPTEAHRVQVHLETCQICQAYVDDALAIRAGFPTVEETPVPDNFVQTVMSALPEHAVCPPASSGQKPRRAPWKRALVPLAACFVVVAAAQSLGLFPQSPSAGNAATDASPAPAPALYGSAPAEAPASAPQEAAPESPLTAEGKSLPQEAAGAAPYALETADAPSTEDAWVEHGNVVFSCLAYLTAEEAGDALAGYEGKPFSDAALPEQGVLGTGYALAQKDFEQILSQLANPPEPTVNQDCTTEQCCIVVTD